MIMPKSEIPKDSKTPRGYGKNCIAYGCSSLYADGISMHAFPRENKPDLRRQWINFVKTRRKDFVKPTPYSFLCERHFTSDSYPAEYAIKRSLNIPVQRKTLLPTAVPTIQTYTKRIPTVQQTEHESLPDPSLPPLTTPKRGAYKKREIQRLILMDSTEPVLQQQINDENIPMDTIEPLQVLEPAPKSVTVGLQFSGRKPQRRSVKVQIKPKVVDAATHCNLTIKPKTVSVGIQCNRYLDVTNPLPTVTPCKPIPNFEEELIEEEDCFRDDPINDTDYEPDSEDYSSDENEVDETEHQVTDRKFIVSQTELLQLFKSCPVCASPSLASVKQVVGTMCKVQQTCSACNHSRVWHSQPSLGAIPEGNLLMSAAILFSGSIPSKAIRFMQHMNVAAISSRTFHNHQKAYIQPAITKTWCQFQNKYIADMIEKQQPLSLGGDGRADTPGHSAKYGSYGMLDLNLMLVVDLQLVQSNEVKSSFHMEKEGFMRSVNFLQGKGLTIGEIVTDRHVQLVKYIREEMTNTTHHFDVLHVAKGLKKKLLALSKEKQCEEIQPWIKSICNHLYWVAASTPDGNGPLMLEKWESLANHIQDIHQHDGQVFKECQHPPLEGRDRQKKWLKPGTKVCEKLQDIVFARQMKKDIPKLSPGAQTAALEGFHSVINHFAPKMIGFSFHGMLNRLLVAALHFNENGMRDQACKSDGSKQYSIVFPKFKKGGYTVREVKTSCTYGYVTKLTETVLNMATNNRLAEEYQRHSPTPPPLCSTYNHPDKQEAVRQFMSRYSTSCVE